MKLALLLTFFTVILAEAPTILDKDNFYKLVVNEESGELIDSKSWLIKFYAPWCSHCKSLAPVWDTLYNIHKNEINIGSVDCTVDLAREICEKYEINGFPTILLLP